jgi:hypothetical protein
MKLTALLTNHPIWGLLTLAVLAWYSTITIYIGVRGLVDIKHMLRNLKQGQDESDAGKKS